MMRDKERSREYALKFQELIDRFDSVTCAACDCMGRAMVCHWKSKL